MTSRSASRCCRAVRDHLARSSSSASAAARTSTHDGVWITDAVLASAFARYCRRVTLPATSATTRRFASNVPGPLESRRRIGKRQMTDQLSLQLSLHPTGSVLPPPWALPNAPDLRQWQWSPPREATEWLSLLSQQQPPPPPPPNAAKSGSRNSSSTSVFPSLRMPTWLTGLGNEVAEASEETEPQRHRIVTAQHLYQNLEAWRSEAPALSEAAFAAQLADVCSEFQAQLSLAALAVDEAREVFGSLWQGLLAKGGGALVAHASVLYAAVLQGIGACRLLQASDFGSAFWRELYVCIAQLPSSSQKAATAAMALDTLLATPPACLADVVDLLPSHLCAIYANTPSTSLGTSTNTSTTTPDKVAQALQVLDLEHHGTWIDATTELLVNSNSSSNSSSSGSTDAGIAATSQTTCSALRTASVAPAWLLTLAHMPQVRQECLFQTMARLQQAAAQAGQARTMSSSNSSSSSSSSAWNLRRADLCELLLAQWVSRGYVAQQTQHAFRRALAASPPEQQEQQEQCALATLALAVFWSKHSRPQCVALYVSLLRSLQTLGDGGRDAAGELVSSVSVLLDHLRAAPPTHRSKSNLPPAAFYESLAWAADDLRTAVRLHELYVRKGGARAVPKDGHYAPALWSVGFWDKFANQLSAALDEGSLTPGQVSHVLDLPARHAQAKSRARAPPQPAKKTYRPSRAVGARTVALVEKLAVHFAVDPNMVPRCALRGVEQCRAFLVANVRRSPAAATVVPNPHDQEAPQTGRSPAVVRALFHLITRDLEAAMPGRTTRLRWFLDIVRREHSAASALASGRALERWRKAAKRHHRAEGQRLVQEDRATLAARVR